MSDAIARCPLCGSARIVSIVGPARRAFCTRCGARWDATGTVARPLRSANGLLRLIEGLSNPPGGDRPPAS
jgi:hypothetical protein